MLERLIEHGYACSKKLRNLSKEFGYNLALFLKPNDPFLDSGSSFWFTCAIFHDQYWALGTKQDMSYS